MSSTKLYILCATIVPTGILGYTPSFLLDLDTALKLILWRVRDVFEIYWESKLE
jgi:hypothetical protein